MAYLAGDRGTSELDLEHPAAVPLAPGGFFQRAGALWEPAGNVWDHACHLQS
jgi:hypothetical protein